MERRIEILWGNLAKMKFGQEMKEHHHSCFQLYYILSGTPVYVISGKPFPVHSGTYFVVPEMCPHSMLPLQEDFASYEVKFFLNDPTLAQRFKTVPPPIEDNGLIRKLLKYVVRNCGSVSVNEEVRSNIESILTTILMSFFIDQLDHSERDSRFVTTNSYNTLTRNILLYIEYQYTTGFSLDGLARSMCYNKNYLSSTFKRNTGYSIVDYLNMVRIHNAVIIFFYYDQDISSASECVGFRDICYFSRVFKLYTGVSPRDFKQALADMTPERKAKRFLIDPILNFRRCSIEEFSQSLRNIEDYCH